MKSAAPWISSHAMFWVSPSSFSTVKAIPVFPTANATSFTFPSSRPFASMTCIETNASRVNGFSVFSIYTHS